MILKVLNIRHNTYLSLQCNIAAIANLFYNNQIIEIKGNQTVKDKNKISNNKGQGE